MNRELLDQDFLEIAIKEGDDLVSISCALIDISISLRLIAGRTTNLEEQEL